MQRFGLGRRVDAEVLGQPGPHPGVGGQSRSRPAGAGQRGHQGPQHGFVVGVVVKPALGEEHGPGQVTAGQSRLRRQLPGARGQPLGLGPLGLGPGRVWLVRQQRPAGQRQRRLGRDPGQLRAPVRHATAGVVDQFGQRVEVEPVHEQGVAGVGPRQPVGAQHPAQPADQHPDLLGRPSGRGRGPHALGQPVDRDRAAAGQGQHLEHGPGLAAAEQGVVDAQDVEPPEHPYPHLAHDKIIPRSAANRSRN